ncbi:MAG TPA: ABC transporter permease [Flavobacteriales bacterium]|nr:ABC transporter permease [Flavobacteriales bacterium]
MPHTRTEHWDVVVEATEPWWRVDLRELWRYRDLIALLIRRDLLAIYKQTVLGPVWQILQPLLTAVVFAVVFGFVGRVHASDVPPVLFYLAAVIPWMFFANVINRTSQTLVWNAALMTKVYFPRVVAPIATTLSTMVGFLLQVVVFIVIAFILHLNGAFTWAGQDHFQWFPLLLLLMTLLAFGTGILVAGLTARYRDLGFLVGFSVQLLMYASPVIFPLSMVPPGSTLDVLIRLNPMTGPIEGFRAVLLGSSFDPTLLVHSSFVTVGVLVIGLVVFQRVQRSFADVI